MNKKGQAILFIPRKKTRKSLETEAERDVRKQTLSLRQEIWFCLLPHDLGTAHEILTSLHKLAHTIEAVGQWRNKWSAVCSLFLHRTNQGRI